MSTHPAHHLNPEQDPTNAEFIQSLFESAGRTIMMLPSSGCWPRGYVSLWPEYSHDFSDFIGRKMDVGDVKMRATSRQMRELEVVNEWQIALAQYCKMRNMIYVARAVALAMLTHPKSGRRVFNDSKIGEIMGADRKTVKSWYQQGYRIITQMNALDLAVR